MSPSEAPFSHHPPWMSRVRHSLAELCDAPLRPRLLRALRVLKRLFCFPWRNEGKGRWTSEHPFSVSFADDQRSPAWGPGCHAARTPAARAPGSNCIRRGTHLCRCERREGTWRLAPAGQAGRAGRDAVFRRVSTGHLAGLHALRQPPPGRGTRRPLPGLLELLPTGGSGLRAAR